MKALYTAPSACIRRPAASSLVPYSRFLRNLFTPPLCSVGIISTTPYKASHPLSAAEIRISAAEIGISVTEIRISIAEIRISIVEIRISAAEIRISVIEIRISAAEIGMSIAENRPPVPGIPSGDSVKNERGIMKK
jgi:hypothetical protein